MTVTHMFNHPRLVSQTPDDIESIAEPSIGISQDTGGLIIMAQEGREILVNRATVKELCKAMQEQVRLFEKEAGK